MSFPKDFIWGAASAAYQIEGAAFEDGRKPSVWDTFSHKDGNVKNNDNGDSACDHYHRYKEDVALMKQIGIKAYRFSISWPRILPEGTGTVNEKGLQFYSDLVDELLLAGIEPYITLFHWDFPQALYDRGGWLNREVVDWFSSYVKIVVEKLSDRVSNWMTYNEPFCFLWFGHVQGIMAPGVTVSNREFFTMLHYSNLAHGKAVQTIRTYSKRPCKIGFVPNPAPYVPATNSEKDYLATKEYTFRNDSLASNTWWLDPVLLGKYPEDGLKVFQQDFPFDIIKDDDMKLMHQPLDFLGINLYEGSVIRYDADLGPVEVPKKTGFDKTAFKWRVIPEIMYYLPKLLNERYQLPIIIAENGLSLADWVSLDGKVHDPNRIDFTHRYLKELKRACEDGVDIKGYFHWSVMDNFEWSQGYNERFGLIHVDYETKKRTLKDSAYWYHDVIQNNGSDL